MVPLIIIASIILFFILFLLLRATVTIQYSNEVKLFVRILFVKIKILPAKKKKVKLGKYQIEKFRKSQKKKYEKALKKYNKKLEKATLKKAEKEKEKEKDEEPKPKAPLSENIKLIEKLVSIFFYRFAKHFRLYIARLKINVATGDAATTAIMYGAVVQSVSYIIEILYRVTNLDKLNKSDIQVNVDYLSDKTTADVCIKFSLCVWHLFDIAIRVAFGYFKYKPTPPKDNEVPAKKKA